MQLTRRGRNRGRRGAILLIAVLFMMIIAGMAAALVTLNTSLHKEHRNVLEEAKAFYVAEAGANEAFATLVARGSDALPAAGLISEIGTGTYHATLEQGPFDVGGRTDQYRVHSVGEAGAQVVGVEIIARRVPTGLFTWALFGHRRVRLESNVSIDSWNSNLGAYPDWLAYANSLANVGSNQRIEIESNTEVHGDVVAGPGGSIDDSASGVTVDGGTSFADADEPMPPILIPAIPVTDRNLMVQSDTTLPPGDHHIQRAQVSAGRLTIQGPARVVLDDFVVRSDAGLMIDTTGGPVEIYATGDFVLRSNSSVRTSSERPRDLSIFITSSNVDGGTADIRLNANADFYGTIYAPDAALGVSSNFTIFGAMKAAAVRLASNSQLHFDEDLLYDPDLPEIYERLFQRRLSMPDARRLSKERNLASRTR